MHSCQDDLFVDCDVDNNDTAAAANITCKDPKQANKMDDHSNVTRNAVGCSPKLTKAKTVIVETEANNLPPCKYGAKCYRKNPSHFEEFSHPQCRCSVNSMTFVMNSFVLVVNF